MAKKSKERSHIPGWQKLQNLPQPPPQQSWRKRFLLPILLVCAAIVPLAITLLSWQLIHLNINTLIPIFITTFLSLVGAVGSVLKENKERFPSAGTWLTGIGITTGILAVVGFVFATWTKKIR